MKKISKGIKNWVIWSIVTGLIVGLFYWPLKPQEVPVALHFFYCVSAFSIFMAVIMIAVFVICFLGDLFKNDKNDDQVG
jgi:hypothetical protein